MKTFNQLLVIALATFSLSAQAEGTFSSHSSVSTGDGAEKLNYDTLKPGYVDMNVIRESASIYQQDHANDKSPIFQATHAKTNAMTNTNDFTLIRF